MDQSQLKSGMLTLGRADLYKMIMRTSSRQPIPAPGLPRSEMVRNGYQWFQRRGEVGFLSTLFENFMADKPVDADPPSPFQPESLPATYPIVDLLDLNRLKLNLLISMKYRLSPFELAMLCSRAGISASVGGPRNKSYDSRILGVVDYLDRRGWLTRFTEIYNRFVQDLPDDGDPPKIQGWDLPSSYPYLDSGADAIKIREVLVEFYGDDTLPTLAMWLNVHMDDLGGDSFASRVLNLVQYKNRSLLPLIPTYHNAFVDGVDPWTVSDRIPKMAGYVHRMTEQMTIKDVRALTRDIGVDFEDVPAEGTVLDFSTQLVVWNGVDQHKFTEAVVDYITV